MNERGRRTATVLAPWELREETIQRRKEWSDLRKQAIHGWSVVCYVADDLSHKSQRVAGAKVSLPELGQ